LGKYKSDQKSQEAGYDIRVRVQNFEISDSVFVEYHAYGDK